MSEMQPNFMTRTVRSQLLAGTAVFASTLAVSAPAIAEVGDGGDRTYVNLSIDLGTHPILTMTGKIMASSEEAGFQSTSYTAVARAGIATASGRLAKTVAKTTVSGTTAEQSTFTLKWTSKQISRVRTAIKKSGRKSGMIKVSLTGTVTATGKATNRICYVRAYLK